MSEHTKRALITHVEIENFKAVKSAAIDLKPLTVVVGVNSSGKSTFIQAILLIVQHLRDEYSTELNYSLNEDLVQLGSFEETSRHENSIASDDLRIQITTETPVRPGLMSLDQKLSVKWDVQLGPEQSLHSRFARVKKLRVTQDRLDASENASEVSRNEIFIEKIRQLQDEIDHQISRIPVDGDRSQLRAVEGMRNLDGVANVLKFAMFYQGRLPVPFQLVQLTDWASQYAEVWFSRSDSFDKQINNLTNSNKRLAAVLLASIKNETESASKAQTARSKQNILVRFSAELSDAFSTYFQNSELWPDLSRIDEDGQQINPSSMMDDHLSELLKGLRRVLTKLLIEFEDDLRDAKVSPSNVATTVSTSILKSTGHRDLLFLAGKSVSEAFFQYARLRQDLREHLSQVHYLGPIRDIDREFSGTFIRRSLGKHGEHCATVLQRESRERITDPPIPPGNNELNQASKFEEILNGWMQYLELASAVEVEDRGRYKAGIKIVPLRGVSKTVSVSSVGVGVAQVLPIVMQCLLAQPEASITIIEQPELHLHPSIEVKLADFFLACARSGRQIFIETHSEHLINRLRLEIAGDQSGESRQIVSVLFANQDVSTGITSYENAVINELGGIEGGWPDKFLDLSTEQSLELLGTAVRRRQADKYADFDDENEDF